MKRFVLSAFTGAFLVSAFAVFAYAEEPDRVDFELEEKTLKDDRVRVEGEFTDIKVKEGVVFRVETKPTHEAMVEALGLRNNNDLSTFATQDERAQLRAMGIDVDPVNPVEADPLADYKNLDEAGKQRFEKARLLYLGLAAKALHNSRMAIGGGMVVGDSFSYLFAKVRGKEVHTEKDPARREKMIQKVLTSLNYRLFSQAPLVASSNEVGLVLTVGVIGVSGAKNKGVGGLVETGLMLGFNKENKSLVMENFIGPERFMNSLSVISVFGLNIKAGFYLASRDKGGEALNRKGVSFYPPAVPGFSSMGPKQFMMGFSSGLTFPPSPFADIMTFSSSHNQVVSLRVEVSKAFKGFVRMSVGEYGTLVKPVFISIKQHIEQVRYGIAHLRGKTCRQAFAIQ